MRKVTLYEIETKEIQAIFSDDGFRIDIEGGESLILRGVIRDIPEEIRSPAMAADMPSSPAPMEDRPKRKYRRRAGPKRTRKTKAAKRSAKRQGKYPCKYGCGESFANRYAAAAHSRYKHPVKQKISKAWHKGKAAAGRKRMSAVKPEQWPYPCDYCERRFKKAAGKGRHEKSAHPEKFRSGGEDKVASEDKKKFTPRQKRAYHGGKAGEPYCSTCDLTFTNNFALEDHQIDKHGMKIVRSGAMAAGSLAASRGATHD
jgi:hypothetical protein